MSTSSATEQTVKTEPCHSCSRANATDARFCSGCGAPLHPSERPEEEDPDPSVADPLIGKVIADRYRIQALLGRGGMGVVYKVEHVHIGKLMAMKLLHGELARDRDTVKRFRREAEAASHLSHPNTVQIFDFGRDQGLMYLVMEYLEGKDLGWVLQHEGPLPLARVARICSQVCVSVAEAHRKGIVHRDLKPENIMVMKGRDRPDLVKVLDFGLAKLRYTEGGQTLTRAGSIIGTPYYMAPEHIRGEEVDARTDVYSLGAVIYKALVGVPPFWASSPVGVLTKHLTDPVIPPSERSSQRDLPHEADAIVLRAMAKDAADRYQSMEELAHDLASYLAGIGESLGDSSLSFPTEGALTTPSGRRAVVQVATRSDVDHYEKRIRRRGWLGSVLMLLAVVGAVAGAYAAYERYGEIPAPSVEVEPNDDPAHANRLPRDRVVQGYLGRRRSETEGDADVYVIEVPAGERQVVRFDVVPPPNMDVAVDVVRGGIAHPALTADSAGVGGTETVPNFPMNASRYYLRVREAPSSDRVYPTENVSDTYDISWRLVEPEAGDEVEVNDSLELAGPIAVGETRRGFIGWAGDIDTYCLAEDAVGVEAALSPLPELDLVLRVVDRGQSSSQKVDLGGAGEGETSSVIGRANAGETCFEVSVNPRGDHRLADADNAYSLVVQIVDEPEPEP